MKKIIIANWKMNLSIKEAVIFLKKMKADSAAVVLASPATFLSSLRLVVTPKKIALAGQNVAKYPVGAYTGEISGAMLKEVGCRYCLVGHSERRIYFGETDLDCQAKIQRLLEKKIKPVLCVGENQQQRNHGQTKDIIKKQLLTALAGIKDFTNILIAYEPVWAISTFQKGKVKKSASLSDIITVHRYIRQLLKNKSVPILYGGTVNPENSHDILNLQEVSGALVGGASLKVSSFTAILNSIK